MTFSLIMIQIAAYMWSYCIIRDSNIICLMIVSPNDIQTVAIWICSNTPYANFNHMNVANESRASRTQQFSCKHTIHTIHMSLKKREISAAFTSIIFAHNTLYNSTSLPLIEQHRTQTQQINPRDQAYYHDYWESTHFKRLGYYYCTKVFS